MDMGQYVEDDELYYEYGADEEYDPYYDPDDPYYDPDDPYAYYGENGEQQEEYEYVAISFHELCTSCIWPSFTQTLWMVFPLLILCLVQRLTWSLFWQDHEAELQANKYEKRPPPSDALQPWLVHTGSIIWGLVACQFFFESNLVWLVAIAVILYPVFMFTYKTKRCGVITAFVMITYLLSCELLIVEEKNWHRIRGAQIILAMKAISLGFDLDSGVVNELPTVFEFGGYIFHVGTIIFGPWVAFLEYVDLLKPQGKKVSKVWLFYMTKNLLISMSCVLASNCLVPWMMMTTTYRWVAAYRDAQSFRFSHYFISYLSQVTAVLTGLGSKKFNSAGTWQLEVSDCYHIELPRSLVEVVTHWNLPMHHWLKTYVFKNSRRFGTFIAIILTYIASSLLHGLNFQLAAVLLSLGFYSYTEFVLRRRLAKIFNACIEAKNCVECNHQYTKWHPAVVVTNTILAALAVFHLTYLGLMFDSSQEEEKGYTMWHTLGKWNILGFASHWVALGSYIIYFLI